MATKKVTSKKPATKKKATKPVKKGVKKTAGKKTTAKKGSKYACTVCGMAITVDTECGCVESCDIICCGEQMKQKK